MTADLREHLQATRGDSYAIERELGGGGMSRVFVAQEARLGRRVVVKVLAPELTEGMSADRFEREVRLAARLQHPHRRLAKLSESARTDASRAGPHQVRRKRPQADLAPRPRSPRPGARLRGTTFSNYMNLITCICNTNLHV